MTQVANRVGQIIVFAIVLQTGLVPVRTIESQQIVPRSIGAVDSAIAEVTQLLYDRWSRPRPRGDAD